MDDQIISISLWAEHNYYAAASQNPAKRAYWRAVLERAESQLEARVKRIVSEMDATASGDPDGAAGSPDTLVASDSESSRRGSMTEPTDISYRIGARDYLRRAATLLSQEALPREQLFYAAFEIRCGVEARLQDYLEVRDEVAKKLKSGWEIAKMAAGLERVFESGDTIAQLAYENEKTGEVAYSLFYTPVTKRLQEVTGRLGGFLHAKQKLHADGDPYWTDFRVLLEEAREGLATSTTGTLLGMPLLAPGGRLKLFIEAQPDDPRTALIGSRKAGDELAVRISYHDVLPDQAKGKA